MDTIRIPQIIRNVAMHSDLPKNKYWKETQRNSIHCSLLYSLRLSTKPNCHTVSNYSSEISTPKIAKSDNDF